MFDRFSPAAHNVVKGAEDAARALHHPYIGTEHLLLAMIDPASGGTSVILREAAADRDRVVAEIGRLCAHPPESRFETDAEALLSIGIDLDAVVAAVERSFGPGALDAAFAPVPRRVRLTPLTLLRRLSPARLLRRAVPWRQYRRLRPRTARCAPAVNGHLLFVPRAKEVLELSMRESARLHHDRVGSEHILLGLLGDGLATQILVGAGLTIGDLRRRTLRALGETT